MDKITDLPLCKLNWGTERVRACKYKVMQNWGKCCFLKSSAVLLREKKNFLSTKDNFCQKIPRNQEWRTVSWTPHYVRQAYNFLSLFHSNRYSNSHVKHARNRQIFVLLNISRLSHCNASDSEFLNLIITAIFPRLGIKPQSFPQGLRPLNPQTEATDLHNP